MAADKRLSARQKRFVQEFLQDGCASAAAIRAGYSPRSAKQVAHRLMRLPHVQEAIAQGQALVQERAEDSAERVVRDLLRACDGAIEDREWRSLGKLMELRCKVQGMLTERLPEKPSLSWADLMRLADEA